MGRLFWKFLFVFWLAQLSTIIGVGVTMWLQGHADHHDLVATTQSASTVDLTPATPDAIPDTNPWHRHSDMHLLPHKPMIAGAVVSLIFAALLSWYFSRPIRVLREAFSGAASGNLDQHIASAMGKRKDELVDLGQSFDTMTAQIGALLNGQRRLLHDVSHELRSPLARLQAIVGLVRQKPDQLWNFLDRLERETMRIDQLIGELLTLARLENGMAFLSKENIDLNLLLDEVMEDAQLEAGDKQLYAYTSQPEQPVWMKGNREMLHRALGNVVRNAIKHAPAGSEVTIELSFVEKSGVANFIVSDEGSGVAADELENIFQPFFRGRSAQSTDGHGLGLAIVREVIESHGGSVAAFNRENGGLTVILTLLPY